MVFRPASKDRQGVRDFHCIRHVMLSVAAYHHSSIQGNGSSARCHRCPGFAPESQNREYCCGESSREPCTILKVPNAIMFMVIAFQVSSLCASNKRTNEQRSLSESFHSNRHHDLPDTPAPMITTDLLVRLWLLPIIASIFARGAIFIR